MLAIQSTKNPQKVIFRRRVRYIEPDIAVTSMLDPDDHYMDLNSVNFPSEGFGMVGSCNGIICVS